MNKNFIYELNGEYWDELLDEYCAFVNECTGIIKENTITYVEFARMYCNA